MVSQLREPSLNHNLFTSNSELRMQISSWFCNQIATPFVQLLPLDVCCLRRLLCKNRWARRFSVLHISIKHYTYAPCTQGAEEHPQKDKIRRKPKKQCSKQMQNRTEQNSSCLALENPPKTYSIKVLARRQQSRRQIQVVKMVEGKWRPANEQTTTQMP